jgi:dihydroorotate dehydrogenase
LNARLEALCFRSANVPAVATELLVAGASAVQIGTANFYDPTASMRIDDALPAALAMLEASALRDIVGTLGNDPVSN